MSRENLSQSLNAVEMALTRLADQLTRGGFEDGAATYAEMVDVIIGQRLWARSNHVEDFDEKFANVATLASRIHGQLQPYCSAMEKLRTLHGLANADDDLDATDQRLLEVLEVTGKALTATAVANAAACPSAETRRRLVALSDRGLLQRLGNPSRPRFRVASLASGQ